MVIFGASFSGDVLVHVYVYTCIKCKKMSKMTIFIHFFVIFIAFFFFFFLTFEAMGEEVHLHLKGFFH